MSSIKLKVKEFIVVVFNHVISNSNTGKFCLQNKLAACLPPVSKYFLGSKCNK